MVIEITGSYNKMVWYANLIGKNFQVAEVHKSGDVRIKNENEINSCWVDKDDYKIVD